MEIKRLACALEAILFVTGEAVSQKELCSALGVQYAALEEAFVSSESQVFGKQRNTFYELRRQHAAFFKSGISPRGGGYAQPRTAQVTVAGKP